MITTENWHDIAPQLRQLWDEGHTTAEIGRRLGVTKNTIAGKAYRLGLPKRDKPKTLIGRPKKVTEQTLPKLRSEPLIEPPAVIPSRQTTAAHDRNAAQVKITARPAKPTPRLIKIPEPTAPPKYGRVINCLWPIGHPGTKDYRSCDTPSEAGRPYCEAHVKVAYSSAGR